MALMNPGLLPAEQKTYTPTDAALDAAEEMAEPVTQRDYPRVYKALVLVNTALWVSYFMGWLK